MRKYNHRKGKGRTTMAYPTMQGYTVYQQPYPQSYQDRLAQLQNQYQQTIPQMQPTQQQTINQGLLWVQGEAGAKSYLVAPNTTVLLMDSENSRFYLKSTDGAGMPSLRTFEYSEVLPNAAQVVQPVPENLDDKYVTRTEYKALQEQYADILNKLNNFPVPAVSEEPAKRTTDRRGKGGNIDVKSDI